MSTEVRWARPDDAADLALVLGEMAIHYRQRPLDRGDTEIKVRRWLEDESPAYPHFALAWMNSEVVGLASVAIAHPGVDLRRLMFLKDLFVRKAFRSGGSGEAILKYLAGECIARDIGRIDLTTEDWNEGALRFYDRLGVKRHGQKVFLRFENLSRLAGRSVE